MSGVALSGMSSGLDTGSIINQLISVEGNQQSLLKNQVTKNQSAVTVYSSLISSAAGLATQARALAATGSWAGVTGSSSSTGVTVKATGSSAASLTFDVTSLAASHTVLSSGSVASSDALVASGPVTLTGADGTAKSIDVGNGSLAEVVSALNSSDSGLRAAAVQISPGAFRLQISSSSQGQNSAFTMSGLDGLGDLQVLQQGSDAVLTVGKGSAAEYTATSASNTFDALMPGLSFTVSKQEQNVTVSSVVDGTAVADQVGKLVDSMNSMLSQISSATSYDVSTKTGGPLLGDSSVRRLQQSLLDMAGGTHAPGLSVSTAGKLSFDRAAFLDAFAKDPQKVGAQFGASTTFAPTSGVTGSVKLIRAGDSTASGSYPIQVTQAAAREQWAVTTAGGVSSGQLFELTRGSTVVSHTVGDGETSSDTVNALNLQLSKSGLGVSASLDGDNIVFTASSSGVASAFTATATGSGAGAAQLTAGRDIAGSINGITGIGSGDVLRLPENSGPASGLALQVKVSDADLAISQDVGSVDYASGFAQALLGVVAKASSSDGGLLVSAQKGRQATIDDLQLQVTDWDRRLTDRRATLTKQFTAMETALSSLKSQTGSITSLLGG